MDIKKFENNLIAFDFDNEIVNATDMIKAFPEKKMNNFLRNQQTKDFIHELELITPISVIKTNVGKYGGTYMSKLLAYKFAAWLSPKFELFVFQTFDKVIQEKLTNQQRQLDYFWDKQDQNDLYK
jgi:hypothetical protein